MEFQTLLDGAKKHFGVRRDYEVAAKLGLNPQTLNYWKNTKNEKKFLSVLKEKICEFNEGLIGRFEQDISNIGGILQTNNGHISGNQIGNIGPTLPIESGSITDGNIDEDIFNSFKKALKRAKINDTESELEDLLEEFAKKYR